ncbi:MAG: hypothetical protein GXO34_06050 [Deltaproteobacteria bacterium]|nr:hypothetical protein [Deltaproteobacteria bacterium]
MEESAAGTEIPDSGLFELIETRIRADSHPEHESGTTSRYHWMRIISALRTLCLQPRFAWGIAAVQAAIIVFFIISPPTGLNTTGHDYKTLSETTVSDSAQDLYLVIFHDSIPVTAVEKLMRQAHAAIIDGPGKNGIFTVKISGDEPARKKAARIFKNSPLVIFFEKQID